MVYITERGAGRAMTLVIRSSTSRSGTTNVWQVLGGESSKLSVPGFTCHGDQLRDTGELSHEWTLPEQH